jgi:arylsulfatase A-like enzyme
MLIELPGLLADLYTTVNSAGTVLLALAAGAVLGQVVALSCALLLSLLFGLSPASSVDRLRHLLWQAAFDAAEPETARRIVAMQPAAAVVLGGLPVAGFLAVRVLIERLNDLNLKAAAILLVLAALAAALLLCSVNVARLLVRLLRHLGWPAAALPLVALWAPSLVAVCVVSVVAVHKALTIAETAALGWVPQGMLVAIAALAALVGVSAWPRPVRGWIKAVLAMLPLLLVVVLGNAEPIRRPLLGTERLARLGLSLAASATDVDRDGFGFLFGGTDCAPLDPEVSPAAREIPGNGIDENCSGEDGVPEPSEPEETDEHLQARIRRLLPTPPHILMITIDSARADRFSCYGYPEATTPNADRLAKSSALFLNAYSPGPNTHSSVPGLLTGRNTFSVSMSIDPATKMMIRMNEDNVTLAELLQEKGYRTAAVLSHRFFDKANRWDQGFDSWDVAVQSKADTISSPLLAQKAISLLRGHKLKHPAAPLFLWVHFYDPHANYMKHAGSPSGAGNRSKRYDGELWFTDRHAGQVIAEARRQLGRNLVIVLSADHGDELGEHGRFGQHRSLHRENLWVPLMVQVPGLDPARIAEPVSIIDIYPTLADLVGAEVPEGVRGESLLPGLIEGAMTERGPVFSEVSWRFANPPEHWVSVTSESARMLLEVNSSTREFYQLEEDPYEQDDLAGAGLEEEVELERLLGRFLETTTVLTASTRSIP